MYTKTGDKGRTTLAGGTRVMKDDMRIVVGGEIDELNADIGYLRSQVSPALHDMLLSIQECLFRIGTSLTCPTAKDVDVTSADTSLLEREIDRMQAVLPPLDTFVLPGGCREAAWSHVCRTVCRRVERTIVAFAREYHVDGCIMQYINRLSDYFFVLALNLNFIASETEKKIYIPCK